MQLISRPAIGASCHLTQRFICSLNQGNGLRLALRLLVALVVLQSAVSTLAADVVLPKEGVQLNFIHVPFRWPAIDGANTYQLQVVEDNASSDPFDGVAPVVDIVNPAVEPRVVVKSGLAFDRSYAWRVRGHDGLPMPWGSTRRFGTLALPSDIPTLTVTSGIGQMEPGLTLFDIRSNAGIFSGGRLVAVDAVGNIQWFLETPNSVGDLRLADNGRIMYVSASTINRVGFEKTLLGQTTWMSPDDQDLEVHHELFPMPNGNFLALVFEYAEVFRDGEFQTWRGDRIVELDRHSLQVVWDWRSFDNFSTLDLDETSMQTPGPTGYDWTHSNAVVYNELDNSVYLSARTLSRITRIDYDTGQIVYNMGLDMPSGDVDFGDDLFSFQHAPELQPNGNMLLFDNGGRRDHIVQTNETGVSKAVELAFTGDPPTTASIAWEFTLPEYAPFVGDADRLPGGNTLLVSGPANFIFEVSTNGLPVWALNIEDGGFPEYLIYRAERIPELIVDTPSDTDGDWDLDLADYAATQRCFTGPGPAGLTFDCSLSDADDDNDVDGDDFAELMKYFSGPV